jgi:hypothetical protein
MNRLYNKNIEEVLQWWPQIPTSLKRERQTLFYQAQANEQ